MNNSTKVRKAAKLPTENTFTSPTETGSLSQIKNTATGHYITRDFAAGKFVNTGDKPAEGIRVVNVFKSASNPSISKETAALAEKAVLAVRNKTMQQK